MAGTAGLGSVRFVTVMLSVVLVGTVSASANPVMEQYLVQDLRATSGEIAIALGIFNIASMLVSLGIGWLADRGNWTRQAFVFASLFAGVCYPLLGFRPPSGACF